LPARIGFAVKNHHDSKTVLDTPGAEKLLGNGDMLYQSQAMPAPVRLQGAYIGNDEVEKVVKFIKENNKSYYDAAINDGINSEKETRSDDACSGNKSDEKPSLDELFAEAVELVLKKGSVSIQLLQRRFSIGFSRATRIMDKMEEMGIIGKGDGAKSRSVLMSKEEFYETYGGMFENGDKDIE
jgi:S-DNA-T family DNA segregation ATPase FtsK/SpoIIIE